MSENKPDEIRLLTLLEVNTNKMNFQQNMCFQMQNWVIVISIALIGFAWKTYLGGEESLEKCMFSILHFVLLFLLGFFLYEKTKWMKYFYVFRERARLIEYNLLAACRT